MGTPYGGAAKVFAALTDGYNFDNPLASDFEMKQVAQNTPSAYELLPDHPFIVSKTTGESLPDEDVSTLTYAGVGEWLTYALERGNVQDPYPLRTSLVASVHGTSASGTPRFNILSRNTQQLAQTLKALPPMSSNAWVSLDGHGISVFPEVVTIRSLFFPPSLSGSAGGDIPPSQQRVALQLAVESAERELHEAGLSPLTLFEASAMAESIGYPRMLFWRVNAQLERQSRSFQHLYGRDANSKSVPRTFVIMGHHVSTVIGFEAWPLQLYLDTHGKTAKDVTPVYRSTVGGKPLAEPEALILIPIWGDGDGTVPLNCAVLPKCERQYFVTSRGDDNSSKGTSARHSDLPANLLVQEIVQRILYDAPPPESAYPYDPAPGLPNNIAEFTSKVVADKLHQIQITLRCDARLVVADAGGRVLGRNSDGLIERTIPQGDFVNAGGAEYVAIANLDNECHTKVTGFRDGHFTLDVEIHRHGQPAGAFAYRGVPVTDGTVAEIRFVPNHLDSNVPALRVTSPQGEVSMVAPTVSAVPVPYYDRTWMIRAGLWIFALLGVGASAVWVRYRVWPRFYRAIQIRSEELRSWSQHSKIARYASYGIAAVVAVARLGVAGIKWVRQAWQNRQKQRDHSKREQWIALGRQSAGDVSLPVAAERQRLKSVTTELIAVEQQLTAADPTKAVILRTRLHLLKSQRDSLLIQIGRAAEERSRQSRIIRLPVLSDPPNCVWKECIQIRGDCCGPLHSVI